MSRDKPPAMNTDEWEALVAATRCPLCGLRHYRLNDEGRAVLDRGTGAPIDPWDAEVHTGWGMAKGYMDRPKWWLRRYLDPRLRGLIALFKDKPVEHSEDGV
jgi:hypothetical protein